MIFFQTHEIEAWINEDAPLVDLTGHLLGVEGQTAELTVKTRHTTRLTMIEEAARIFQVLGAEVVFQAESGCDVEKGAWSGGWSSRCIASWLESGDESFGISVWCGDAYCADGRRGESGQ
ncbi:hypothetical protein THIOSC15_3230005 [uncultured Thiomicrorhabdus sp.]